MSPEINLSNYDQLILTRMPIIHGGKNRLSTNGAGTTEYPHLKNEVVPLSHTTYKN